MAGKGGGAWKVAYADLVTAMMAFFMVMWVLAQSKDVKEAVAQYFREPPLPFGWKSPHPAAKAVSSRSGGSAKTKGARGRGASPRTPETPPSDEPTAPSISRPGLLAVHDGKRSTMGAVVFFAEQSTELSEQAKQRLKRLVPFLVGKRNKIEIRGHTSRRPVTPGIPAQDPWQICYARCLAAMHYLEQEGVEPDRIRLSQAGTAEPYTIREDPEKQAKNARVEVYLLAELAEELVGTREERAERFHAP